MDLDFGRRDGWGRDALKGKRAIMPKRERPFRAASAAPNVGFHVRSRFMLSSHLNSPWCSFKYASVVQPVKMPKGSENSAKPDGPGDEHDDEAALSVKRGHGEKAKLHNIRYFVLTIVKT